MGVRERILESALAVLREGGLQSLTQVSVAERAGVRQSHLTYYFPTRQALLEATTEHYASSITKGVSEFMAARPDADAKALLAYLVNDVVDLEHTRMFLGVIVEADADPALRGMMLNVARQLEAGLTQCLGGPNAKQRARIVLAAIWGLAVHQFVTRASGREGLARPYLAWLTAGIDTV